MTEQPSGVLRPKSDTFWIVYVEGETVLTHNVMPPICYTTEAEAIATAVVIEQRTGRRAHVFCSVMR